MKHLFALMSLGRILKSYLLLWAQKLQKAAALEYVSPWKALKLCFTVHIRKKKRTKGL